MIFKKKIIKGFKNSGSKIKNARFIFNKYPDVILNEPPSPPSRDGARVVGEG